VSRQQMGMAVIMGMLVATLLGIFLVPVLFVVIEKLSHRGAAPAPAPTGAPAAPPTGGAHAAAEGAHGS